MYSTGSISTLKRGSSLEWVLHRLREGFWAASLLVSFCIQGCFDPSYTPIEPEVEDTLVGDAGEDPPTDLDVRDADAPSDVADISDQTDSTDSDTPSDGDLDQIDPADLPRDGDTQCSSRVVQTYDGEQATWLEEACERDQQCVDAVCIDIPEDFGTICDAEEDGCEGDGLQCLDSVCLSHPPQEVRGQCIGDAECTDSLLCTRAGYCQEGKDGDSCFEDEDCDGSLGLHCGLEDLCVARIEGDDCEANTDCPVDLYCATGNGQCQDGSSGDYCDANEDCTVANQICDGTCRFAGYDENCIVQENCEAGLYCANSLCQNGSSEDFCRDVDDCVDLDHICGSGSGTCRYRMEGDVCAGDEDCPLDVGFCASSGVCQDGSEGDLCGDHDDCSRGNFCDASASDESPSCAVGSPLGAVCETDGDCPDRQCSNNHCVATDFAYIQAGSFCMGSPGGGSSGGCSDGVAELERTAGEGPLHEVTLSRPFLLQTTEVTQGQWGEHFGELDPSYFDECGVNCPVEQVTWWDALSWLNAQSVYDGFDPCFQLTGCDGEPGDTLNCTDVVTLAQEENPYRCEGYRLPTEAEWEYAYRAGTDTAFFNGDITQTGTETLDMNLQAIGWYGGNSLGETHVVSTLDDGGKSGNAWGLFNLPGNVREWVWDWFQSDYYASSPSIDPLGGTGTLRVTRGGSYISPAEWCRAAFRFVANPDGPGQNQVGFRPARTVFAPHCYDELENGDEGGLDCGGSCAACQLGETCSANDDCASGNCSNDHCAVAGYSYIPAGTFCMGSPDGETECMGETKAEELRHAENELLHEVTLTRPFFIGQTEVTQRQWADHFPGSNPSKFVECGLDCPVEDLTWWEAIAFVNALSVAEGLEPCYSMADCHETEIGQGLECTSVSVSDPGALGNPYLCEGYRLPTEAEWEYAARAGTTTAFYSGNITETYTDPVDPKLDEIGWYGGNSGVSYETDAECADGYTGEGPCGTQPVAGREPNTWGLFDATGNVWEWVWDGFADYPSTPVTDPDGSSDPYRVSRGCGWDSYAQNCRTAARDDHSWDSSYRRLGFRVARSAFPVTCTDGISGGDETDIDCGGSCAPCGLGAACSTDTDCADEWQCSETHTCETVALGEPCSRDYHCDDDLYCSLGACSAGIEGDECESGRDCSTSAAICSTEGVCQDGEEGDECGVHSDCSGEWRCYNGTCGTCVSTEAFDATRTITLSEPCAEISPAYPDSCYSASMANPDGASSWQRINEPVELALVNGIIDSSVVGYWPLDGGVAVDQTGNLATGVVNGAQQTPGAFGDENGALLLDGDNDYLTMTQFSDVPTTESTLCIWFQVAEDFPDGDTDMELVRSDPASDAEDILWQLLGSTGRLTFEKTCGDDWRNTFSSRTSWAANQWNHVCMTSRGGLDQLYINGTLDDSGSEGPGCASEGLEEYVFFVGGFGGVDGDNLNGSLDELLVFNRALSPAEIAAYYSSGQPYGTSLLPGAQTDYDDVRVTEQGFGEDAHRVTHEIVGVRPHSDSDLDNIIAYWRLDDGTTDDVAPSLASDETDTYSSGNNLALPAQGRFGDRHGAFHFNGTTTYVNTNYTPDLSITDSFTIEAWARIDDATTTRTLWGAETTGEAHLNLLVSSDSVVAEVFDTAGNGGNPQGVVSLGDGDWHHFAVVRDATNDLIILYVDGFLLDSRTDESAVAIAPGLPLFLGATHTSTAQEQYLLGSLDEVIIHDVARSADYIYNRAAGLPTVRFLASTEAEANENGHFDYETYRLIWDSTDAEYLAPLVQNPTEIEPCEGLLSPCNGYAGWWRFDEASGDVAIDSSTNRNHALITGSPGRSSGLAGIAYDFDGTGNNYVTLPTGLFDEMDSTTYMAAVSPSSIERGDIIYALAYIDWIALGMGSSGQISAQLGLETDSFSLQTSDSIMVDDWTHLAVSYDGSDADIFWDGSEASLAGETQGSGAIVQHGMTRIARRGTSDEANYHGLIDEVVVFDRDLSPDEFPHYPLSSVAAGTVSTGDSAACGFSLEPQTFQFETDYSSEDVSTGLMAPWIVHSGEWSVVDGELHVADSESSDWSAISAEVGFWDTFDLSFKARRGGGEIGVAINAVGGIDNDGRNFGGGFMLKVRLSGLELRAAQFDEPSYFNVDSESVTRELGEDYSYRVTYDGTTLRGKAWLAADDEPASFMLEAEIALPERWSEVVLFGDGPTGVYFDDLAIWP